MVQGAVLTGSLGDRSKCPSPPREARTAGGKVEKERKGRGSGRKTGGTSYLRGISKAAI